MVWRRPDGTRRSIAFPTCWEARIFHAELLDLLSGSHDDPNAITSADRAIAQARRGVGVRIEDRATQPSYRRALHEALITGTNPPAQYRVR